MRFLYISSPSVPPVSLRVNASTVGELVAMMRWTMDDVEMVRLARHPYVLLRRYVPRDSRAVRSSLLRIVDTWDMVSGSECLVARLDGQDVEEGFDVWEHAVHPFDLYEVCDYRAPHKSMDGHVSYFSWGGGKAGPVIYAWPKKPSCRAPRGPGTTARAAVAAARQQRTRKPLSITPSVRR